MSERHETGPQPSDEIRLDDLELHQYFGQKLVRETFDEFGFTDSMDEGILTDLRTVLGAAAETGLLLAGESRTTEKDVAFATSIVLTSYEARLRAVAGPFISYQIQRGIDFEPEITEASTRVNDWTSEFYLMHSLR